MSNQYQTVIGLEIHAQTNTRTKMFCRCDNDSFNKEPNTNVCPICMGFPGTLPTINQTALEKGIQAALAINCKIKSFSKFDRKNYFYPDLPKGFQISQFDQPLSENGHIEIEINDQKKRIGITRLHLEDDAGKLTHVLGGSLCDYNRSGTPLMEIVSEPDLSSAEEASLYAREIQKILRYVGASDCDMEKGMMRFDINVSLKKPEAKEFGTKTEVKNLNSFRALEKALEYEIHRQTEVLDQGEKIIHETRGFDPQKETTFSQRTKEEAQDYRYFPEPDLPPIVPDEKLIEKLKKELPELPTAKATRFKKDFNLSDEETRLLIQNIETANFFETAVKISQEPKKVAAFITTVLFSHLKEEHKSLTECKIKAENLGELIKLINDGTISNNLAKGKIFEEMYKTGQTPQKIIEEKGLKQVSDTNEIESLCQKAIQENNKVVQEYKNGKETAIGFLIGQVMQATKGQANPKVVNETMRRLLS